MKRLKNPAQYPVKGSSDSMSLTHPHDSFYKRFKPAEEPGYGTGEDVTYEPNEGDSACWGPGFIRSPSLRC